LQVLRGSGGQGDNTKGQSTVPAVTINGVTAMAGGGYHSLALLPRWIRARVGDNSSGQTNVPSAANQGSWLWLPANTHSLASSADGSVIAWVAMPMARSMFRLRPCRGSLPLEAVIDHSIALKQDGSVVAWGSNEHGQSTVPVGAQGGVKAVSAGGFDNLALKDDGSVVAWGSNWFGQADVPGFDPGIGDRGFGRCFIRWRC
jgi:hypothetical protein